MNTRFRLFLFVGILSIALVSCKSKQKVTEIPAANEPATTAVSTNVPPVTSPRTTAARTTASTHQQETTRSEAFRLADGESNSDALSKKYHVVVGAFGNHDNARRLRSKLSNEGNNALTVQNDSGMLRVIIGSFDEYSQARARIEQIKSTYSDAWVLVQK